MLKQDIKINSKVVVGVPVRVKMDSRKDQNEDTKMKEHYKVYRITPEVVIRIIDRIRDL